MTYNEQTQLHPAAAVCLLEDDQGRVLSVSRGYNLNDLGLPGGKVEAGETPVVGALRELWEETGLTARPEDCTFLYKQKVGRYMVWTFQVKKWSGELLTATREGVPLWVDAGRLCTDLCTFGIYNQRAIEALNMVRATSPVSAF